MRKKELRQLINLKFDEVLHFVRTQNDSEFAISLTEGKWSAGQNLDHLRKSTKVINKIMRLPKLIHLYKFGRIKNAPDDYESLERNYKNYSLNGIKAPEMYHPNPISNTDKKILMDRFDKQRELLIDNLYKAKESYLNNYAVPHPKLGKLSMKSILYFTCIHTEHHLDLMKKYC